MNVILAWIRSNLASVVFIVVMVGALVALPIVAGKLNAGLQSDMDDRLSQLQNLEKLEKTEATFGSEIYGDQTSRTVLINERLLDRLRDVSASERADADEVLRRALEHNSKGRGVLYPRLFPAPPPAEREVLPEQFHRVLVQAYDVLLDGVRAGSPPEVAALNEDLERRRAQFLTQTLQKDASDRLEPEEEKQLSEFLTKQRMSRYAEQAERIGVYAGAEALAVPAWEQARQPTMSELFEWQWQYWMLEDILGAIAEANTGAGSVQQAPVKRVRGITTFAVAGGESAGGDTGRRGGGQSSGGGKANPSREVRRDYAASFTGRVTNPLFDVRLMQVDLIVDTARLPQVLDALAARNFITVLDVDMYPADQYEAAKEGFFYGSAPVSEVSLLVESVWLREWTTEFMPDETKQMLGIAVESSS